MKKFFALIAVLLLASSAFALTAGEKVAGKYNYGKQAAYRLAHCSIGSNLDSDFTLKSTCPRYASISGEDLSIEFLKAESTTDWSYVHFKVSTGGNVYEFVKSPSWSPTSVGNYLIYVEGSGIFSAGTQTIWSSAKFSVSKV